METTKVKQSMAHSQTLSSEKTILKQGYLLNKDSLVPVPLEYISSNSPVEKKFRSAKELEELVFKNSKTLFGQTTFMVALQKKDGVLFGNDSVPTGLMLDLCEPNRPRFYILDIMLAGQSFFGYVFPRITKFFSLFKSEEAISQLCEIVGKDKELKKALQANGNGVVIPAYLKNAIAKPVILLVMDSEMKELPEIMETYSATWQTVKPVLIQKYASNGNTFCTMHPSFEEIYRTGKKERVHREKVTVNEEDHLRNVSENVRELYNKLKTELLKINDQLQFNAQKYYISLRKDKNIAFFHFSHMKISLVVMNPEKDTRKMIKHHVVKILTEKVQKFWNGSSCTIVIESDKYLNEVIALLKKMIAV